MNIVLYLRRFKNCLKIWESPEKKWIFGGFTTYAMSYSQIHSTSQTLDIIRGFSDPSNTKILFFTDSSLYSNSEALSATAQDFSSFRVVSFSLVLLKIVLKSFFMNIFAATAALDVQMLVCLSVYPSEELPKGFSAHSAHLQIQFVIVFL